MAAAPRYFVVPAPGTYGEVTNVLWSSKKLEDAKGMCPRGYVVRIGDRKAGSKWYPRDEAEHPVIWEKAKPAHATKSDRRKTRYVQLAWSNPQGASQRYVEGSYPETDVQTILEGLFQRGVPEVNVEGRDFALTSLDDVHEAANHARERVTRRQPSRSHATMPADAWRWQNVRMKHRGRELLGTVRHVRLDPAGKLHLVVHHFNGEPWPVEPASSSVKII